MFKKNQNLNVDSVLFSDVFRRFIKNSDGKKVLEIGCAGGLFLCHLTKHYHLKPYGIDYSDKIDTVKHVFNREGIKQPILFKEDFIAWKTKLQFDIVCSFGFIEHFKNFQFILRKHASLVKDGGLLIVSVPHFRRVQYILHLLLDKENLKRHNTKIMNPKLFHDTLTNLGLNVELSSYYGTFDFWHEHDSHHWFNRRMVGTLWYSGRILNSMFGKNKANSFMSPHIICVAKK